MNIYLFVLILSISIFIILKYSNNGQDLHCADGFTDCGNLNCFNLLTDTNNCGACGNIATGTCCSGQDKNIHTDNSNCGSCGTVVSGTCCNGHDVDTQTNISNCGECGNICPEFSQCCSGQCWGGSSGQACCNGQRVDDTNTDTNNCGSCGTVCDTGASCLSGSCTE